MTLGELRKLREQVSEEFDRRLLTMLAEGTTQQEIAAALGITQQAVSDLARRARRRTQVAA